MAAVRLVWAVWAVLASVLVLQTRSQVLGDVFLYVSASAALCLHLGACFAVACTCAVSARRGQSHGLAAAGTIQHAVACYYCWYRATQDLGLDLTAASQQQQTHARVAVAFQWHGVPLDMYHCCVTHAGCHGMQPAAP